MKTIGLVLGVLLFGSLSHAVTGEQLSCSVYKYDVVDGQPGEAQLLAQQSNTPFDMNGQGFIDIPLDAPFDNLDLMFNAFSFNVTTGPNTTPYLQAYFYDINTGDSDASKDVSYSLTTMESGDKITLQGMYQVNDQVALSYVCDLTAL